MSKILSYIVMLTLIPWPVRAIVDTSAHPLITEVMTATTETASAEYIELFNPNDEAYTLEDHALQYKSATGSNWITKLEFEEDEAIEPRGFYLIVTDEFIAPDHDFGSFNAGLAGSAGHVRLTHIQEVTVEIDGQVTQQQQETAIDQLGYGEDADSPELAPAKAPQKDFSLKRIVNEDGEFIDTNDNSLDFIETSEPHPQHTLPPQIEVTDASSEPTDESQNNSDNSSQEDTDSDTAPVEYDELRINELLVDPTSPQTDAEDEFVELFNPHNYQVDLDGYTLKTGSSLQYSFTFENESIDAKSHRAWKSSESNLTLANSGARAQLIDPNGNVASDLVAYDQAPAGESWSYFDDGFEWSDMVTLGAENQRSRIEPEVETRKVAGAKTGTVDVNRNYARIVITEALPDPAKPALDKNDEFVELYNPNNIPVSLEGYKLKTGKILSSNQTLGSIIIQPKQYIALFSAENRMTLGNSGGQVQLQDPNGNPVSSAEPYGDAPEGAAWVLVDSEWRWSAKPTPAAKNEAVDVAKSGSNSSQQSNNSSANSALAPDVISSLSQPAAIPVRPTDFRLIGGALAFAVLYGVYEFRHDIFNRINQSRSYFGARFRSRK